MKNNIWDIAARYNKRSRELNGATTTALRRAKGQGIEDVERLMGREKLPDLDTPGFFSNLDQAAYFASTESTI